MKDEDVSTHNRTVYPTWRSESLVDETRRLHSLTGQCALILGEAIEFVVDVKEALRESPKFTLPLGLQLRLE